MKDQHCYQVRLLRYWCEPSQFADAPAWRFSIEDPISRERCGFNCLESLMAYLTEEIDRSSHPREENVYPEECRDADIQDKKD